MKKEPFINVSSLGELRIRDVFVRMDYPKIFVCEDALQVKYLFYEIDSEYDFDSWLVVRISNKRYYDLITQRIGIVSAFTMAEENKFHTITHYYNDNKTVHEIANHFERSLLSIEDFYPSIKIEYPENSELIEESLELGSTLIDFRLFPNNHSIKDIEVSFLTSLCNKIKTLINSVNPVKSFKPRVSTHPGSFIIRFNLNDDNNLFIEDSMITTVNKVHMLLSAEKPSDINLILNSSKTNIDNYKSLINLLSSNKTDIEINSASPSSKSILSKYVSMDSIKNTQKYLENFYDEKKYEDWFIGTMIAVDTKKGKFTFSIENQKDSITGIIPKEFNEIFEVPHNYRIQVKITEKIVISDSDKTALQKEYELQSIQLL